MGMRKSGFTIKHEYFLCPPPQTPPPLFLILKIFERVWVGGSVLRCGCVGMERSSVEHALWSMGWMGSDGRRRMGQKALNPTRTHDTYELLVH